MSASVEAPTAASVDSDLVLVSKFARCDCREYGFTTVHLSVYIDQVPLKRGNAVAISYAIGDFNVQKRTIGHTHDDVALQVALDLGEEWTIEGLQHRLVELTERHNAIWLDQLSIFQEAEIIRLELGRIPQIYGTFDVVILLPGSLCTCLEKAVELYEAGGLRWRDPKTDEEDLDRDALLKIDCFNMFGMCSYLDRLWCVQEVRQSSHARLVWCLNKPAECLTESHALTEEMFIERLSPYSKLRYRAISMMAEKPSHRRILYSLRLRQKNFWLKWENLFLVRRTEEQEHVPSTYLQTAKFLLGAPMESAVERYYRSGPAWVNLFRSLALTELNTTKPEDLVLAPWPSFTWYRIPAQWQKIPTPVLLTDALQQYEREERRALISQLPAGLFRPAGPTAVWRPHLHLHPSFTRTSSDLYGACTHSENHVPLSQYSTMGLRFTDHKQGGSKSRLLRSLDFLTDCKGATTDDILQIMRRVAQNVPSPSFLPPSEVGFSVEKLMRGSSHSEELVAEVRSSEETAFELFKRKAFDKDPCNWGNLPEINVAKVLYEMAAAKLHTRAGTLLATDTRIALAPDEPAQFGVMAAHAFRNREEKASSSVGKWVSGVSKAPLPNSTSPAERSSNSSTVLEQPGERSPPQRLSIFMEISIEKLIIYEAVLNTTHDLPPEATKAADDGRVLPVYSVVGIGLPTFQHGENAFNDIGAYVLHERDSGKIEALLY